MNVRECNPEEFVKNESQYIEFLKNPKNLSAIPMLFHCKLHELQESTLVRFSGMIQDMWENELYLEKYEVRSNDNNKIRVQNGKYRDTLVLTEDESVDYDATNNIHGERRLLCLVTIPGYNEWATNVEKDLNCNGKQSSTSSFSITSDSKRPIETLGDDNEDANIRQTRRCADYVPNAMADKKSNILTNEYLINSPIHDRPSKACIIKIYGDLDKYRLNTIVDVIGFLSVNPALDGSNFKLSEFEDINEVIATNPPPSLIPRIHAVYINELNHSNPLLNEINSYNENIFDIDDTKLEIYKDIHLILTQILFGDCIAAEYLMCHLLSSVYIRTDGQCRGQFSLNISNIPAEVLTDYSQLFYDIIQLLIPASYYLPMTIENMNSLQFTPRKDYDTNKLISGILQLAPHTHLILDETRLHSGKLEEMGVKAISNIAYLINNQAVKYDFKFYEIDYDVDIPILILSEGKSMLPCDFHMPLKPDQDCIKIIRETIVAGKHFLQKKLTNIRIYITAMKIKQFCMSSNMLQEMVQNDFIEIRRNNKTIDPENSHKLIVLTRLLGLSKGKSSLDYETWNRAKELEEERLQRIRKINGKKN